MTREKSGIYIKKEDAIKAFEDSLKGKYILWDTQDKIKADVKKRLSDLPTYSFPDREKGEWIDNGNCSYTCSYCKKEWTSSQIEEMYFCPTCGNPKGERR